MLPGQPHSLLSTFSLMLFYMKIQYSVNSPSIFLKGMESCRWGGPLPLPKQTTPIPSHLAAVDDPCRPPAYRNSQISSSHWVQIISQPLEQLSSSPRK